jgi:hypothetical protein
MLPTTYPHRCPSTPFPPHLKPPYCTGISPYGRSSGSGNLTSETSWATSSNPSTYCWTPARCSFVVRSWFLAKCAAVCFGTMAVRHSTHAMIRCLCEWWKYRVKTLAWGGVGAGASIARPMDLPDRMAAGCYRCVGCRISLRSGYGCSGYMSMLPTTCLCTYGYTSSYPNPSEPYTIPPLPPPTTAPRLRLSVSGGPYMWLRLLLVPGAASVGSGPVLEHQNRPHPSGGGIDTSRPYGFSMLKNTRIASGRCRIPPA